MRTEFKIVVALYVIVLIAVFSLVGALVAISAYSSNNVDWVQPMVAAVLDLAKVVVGAVVGALSTATAFMFGNRKE